MAKFIFILGIVVLVILGIFAHYIFFVHGFPYINFELIIIFILSYIIVYILRIIYPIITKKDKD